MKDQLRKELLSKRRANPKPQQKHASLLISEQIQSLACFKKANHVALYHPFAGEVSLLNLASYNDKTFYLPVIHGESLVFKPFNNETSFENNQFNISEPNTDVIQPITELDIVFVPLVGVDKNGHRLGMGKGFYDKTFSGCSENTPPLLVGVAYDFQVVEELPVESHDVTLDLVITESTRYCCNQSLLESL